jgi:hypothetical protein
MAYSHLHYLYREATWYLILCNPKVAFYQLHYVEPNYITENKPQMQAMFEILKPSLDICYTILNQILYYMQQLGPAFWGYYFTGLPASPAVKCSRSMLVFFLDQLRKCVT